MTDVDVLVVGAGPSGLTVAAEVARTGARVLVVEKRSVSPIPRAGTVLPRPLELFDARGIVGRFVKRTSEFNPHPFSTWHVWAGMHPVDWSSRDSRFNFTLYLPQHETELILQDWAADNGASIRFEHELVGVEQDADQVRATIRDATGAETVVTAGYLVGADGGRSRTRECAGIAFEGRSTSFTGIIATVELEFPWQGGTRVEHNEKGWSASFPFGPGLTRFTLVHAEARHRTPDEPVTPEEVAKCVHDIYQEQIDIPESVVATRFGDAHLAAARLRQDRVFLVGEAARLHYPASGVGMNYCIQDAFNLGWKLGAVVRGHAGPGLLDTYESERRPIIDDLLTSADAQVAVQFDFTPQGLAFLDRFAGDFLPNPGVTAALWDDLNGLRTPYDLGSRELPCVGSPAPDLELFQRDGTTVRLYELLRETPFVVLDLSGEENISAAEVKDLPATVVHAHPIRLPSALAGAQSIVVRPDTYVAWAKATVPAPGEIRAAVGAALHLDVG